MGLVLVLVLVLTSRHVQKALICLSPLVFSLSVRSYVAIYTPIAVL